MKKIVTALAGAACLMCAATAHAGLYKFDFTATDFRPSFEGYPPPPQDSISGWIVFTADALGAPVTSIEDIDLTIAGHQYTVDEIGVLSWPSGYLFGGTAWIINGISSGTDDFWVSRYGMTYAASGRVGIWDSYAITSSYTELVSEVPEPGSLALLLAGAGALGTMLRRRRRV